MEAIIRQLDRISNEGLTFEERRRAVLSFAHLAKWGPSDLLTDFSDQTSLSFAHLLVEHGLGNAAVLTFLRPPYTFESLPPTERDRLLSVSYNNLVDWQLFPSSVGVGTVFVRSTPARSEFRTTSTDPSVLHSDSFSKLTAHRPQPNIKSLDDVLIDVVTEWKRNLHSDLSGTIGSSSLTSLFNTIIFVRALEDERKWKEPAHRPIRILPKIVDESSGKASIGSALADALDALGVAGVPFGDQIITPRALREELRVFGGLSPQTVRALFSAFYARPWIPYEFDFAVISKQALSRIYEKYVVELREPHGSQLSLFRDLPREVEKKDLGAVYTPHFIARFFARVVQANVTPAKFLDLRMLDPAVGSGMFLRTLAERQCAPSEVALDENLADKAITNIWGVDVDPDACNAARLSLALLHLSLTGHLPKKLNIVNAEALEFARGQEREPKFDVVVTNPPFVKYERLQPRIQQRVKEYLAEQGSGRVDLYLALLKVALDLCSESGLVLYVLPEAFLLSNTASLVRKRIAQEFDVLYLIDLTAVPVFEGVGAYVVLLVLRRRKLPDSREKCIVAKVRRNLPAALTASIRRQVGETNEYAIFSVPQTEFSGSAWRFVQPSLSALMGTFANHPTSIDILDIRQGVVTGDDDVFTLPVGDPIAKDDAVVWRPLLRDREMLQFGVPSRTSTRMFYPFDKNGSKIDEDQLKAKHPSTWKHLSAHKKRLAARKSVIAGRFAWWEPESPRDPDRMLSPKIVCPHLMLTPKFSLDSKGTYLVSHTMVVTAKEASADSGELLRFMVAVMNSPFFFWQLQFYSHTYSRGYLRVETSTLKSARVPNPAQVPAKLFRRVMRSTDVLLDMRSTERELKDAIRSVNDSVREAYGLNDKEAREMGWSGDT